MGVSTGVAGVLDAADLHLGPGLVAGFATIGSVEAVPVRWLADVEPHSQICGGGTRGNGHLRSGSGRRGWCAPAIHLFERQPDRHR